MRLLTIKCVSLSGMLMNPMDEKTLMGLLTKTPVPKKTDVTREDIAKDKIYRDPTTNQMGIPAGNLLSCLTAAGAYEKVNKKQLSTGEKSIIPSFLAIQEEFIPFDSLDEEGNIPYVADMRRGVMKNGASSVAVAIVRPLFKAWGFTCHVEFDEKQMVSEDIVKNLFNHAGSKVGLGDFRPAKRGPFGRFRFVEWKSEELKYELKAAA